jgi:hypothetical protein
LLSCTLEIGGRIVARAEGGPFDAEYALFESHEIELRSNNEPGTVREHGYRTTAELALERLEIDGVNCALANAAAAELGALATAYARGAEVRRVVALLGACELFEGRSWQASARQYDGGWLDVAALASDLGLEGAPRLLQTLHLVTLLAEVPADSTVYLSTTDYTAGRRPGERTHRRVPLDLAPEVPGAIQKLADRRAAHAPREGGPSRSELLDGVRARIAVCKLDKVRVSLEALEQALSVRERPQRGPLSDPDLWALELQLAEGDPLDAQQRIDALEKLRGRQPGTAYLRGRAALLLGGEEPRLIAERASSLAMSMNSFPELELLAAEAWAQAGERKRALAYARDLAENPQVDELIRARARVIVEPPPPSAPDTLRVDVPDEGPPPSAGPSSAKVPVAITAGLRASAPSAPSSRPPVDPRRRPSQLPTSTVKSIAPGSDPGTAAPASRSRPPEEGAWDAPIAPTPILSIGVGPISSRPSPRPRPVSDFPPASSEAIYAPPPRDSQSTMRAPTGSHPAVVVERQPSIAPLGTGTGTGTRPSMRSSAALALAPPDLPPAAQGLPVPSSPPPPSPAPLRGSARPPSMIDLDEVRAVLIKGGSQPPFRTEPPTNSFAAISLPVDSERVEKAEMLSLPPGLHGESFVADQLPTDGMEARVYFTHLSRELGRLYRQRYNVELRTELRSIEILQRHLAERFEARELTSREDVLEVRLHGAFLSEILARRLGATWTDLAVSEIGYWSMGVPPGTTVWPIGRVVRFVTMRHRERDLVSYFLELQARAHGLR